MILSRQDKLINKLVLDRKKDQEDSLPLFLIDYLKKMFRIEMELHEEIETIKKKGNLDVKMYQKGSQVNWELLRHHFIEKAEHNQQQCPSIIFDLAQRYITHGNQSQQSFLNFQSLFTFKNCTIIQNYLQSKDKQYQQNKSKQHLKDPYLHRQFHKLQQKHQHRLCFRQIKSVQNHISRNNNNPSTLTIKNNIKQYTKQLGRMFTVFFNKIKKIIKLNSIIEQSKETLLHNNNCNFHLLFRQISQNYFIVPSQLQHYLHNIGIDVALDGLFIFFKKYGDSINGKITIQHFVKIYRSKDQKKGQRRKEEKKEEKIDRQFRKNAIKCILEQIKNQIKIQKIKKDITAQTNLRQIFDGLDIERKGKISRTDLEVACKRITSKPITTEQLTILWKRMNKQLNQYIDYDTFMFQLLPRLRSQNKTKTCHPLVHASKT